MHDLTTSTDWMARARRTAVQRLFLDRQTEFWLGRMRRTWSLAEIRAQVVAVVEETRDVKTFRLRPNRRWAGHRAGQYAAIAVEVDGVRVRRCYSISSAPGQRLLSITVKRVPGGRVSRWLHEHVRPGHVVGLDPAAGDFVLPDPPAGLLMLSGGSGITPLMSMLRSLAAGDGIRDLTFVHHTHAGDDPIFGDELEALAGRHRGLRLIHSRGRFDEDELARRVPDFARRQTLLCGPAGLMARVEAMWREAGASGRLQLERFTAAPARPLDDGEQHSIQVHLARSGRTVAASTAGTLLEQLERAGERPPHGCRMGICHTCRCRKRTGAVQNLVTGAVSTEPDEEIQVCVSVPRSDVELDL